MEGRQKKKKHVANHWSNQGLLDYLVREAWLLDRRPGHLMKWQAVRLKGVIRSVEQHETVIDSIEEAQKLKGVGKCTSHLIQAFLDKHPVNVDSCNYPLGDISHKFRDHQNEKTQIHSENKMSLTKPVTESRDPKTNSTYWMKRTREFMVALLESYSITCSKSMKKQDLCIRVVDLYIQRKGDLDLVAVQEKIDAQRTGELAHESEVNDLSLSQNACVPAREHHNFAFSPAPPSTITPVIRKRTYTFMSSETSSHTREWELVLLLDNREKVNSEINHNVLVGKLLEMGVNVESRALPLGDVLWILREKGGLIEYVTDYIIERKQAGDLAGSIKDGRYKEQAYRLIKTKLKRVMYLVEGSVKHQQSMNPKLLESAMATIQVVHGFALHMSPNIDTTVEFLHRMNNLIKSITIEAPQSRWKGPNLSQEQRFYENFKNDNKKRKLDCVGDIFGAQIKQLQGCSGPRALAIVEKFPTPIHLLDLYEKTLASKSVEEKRLYFQNLLPEGQTKCIGRVLSSKLYDMYNIM